jgi:hypothetical protein
MPKLSIDEIVDLTDEEEIVDFNDVRTKRKMRLEKKQNFKEKQYKYVSEIE